MLAGADGREGTRRKGAGKRRVGKGVAGRARSALPAVLLEHPYGGGYFGNWVDNVHNAIDINTGLSDVNTERRGFCAECVNSVADWGRGRDWRVGGL